MNATVQRIVRCIGFGIAVFNGQGVNLSVPDWGSRNAQTTPSMVPNLFPCI